MVDSSTPMHLVHAEEVARQINDAAKIMADAPTLVNVPLPVFAVVAEVARLAALVERLGQRIEALEAELVPSYRSRKCPACHTLSLAVVATRPHPQFGTEGIEQHDVRCSCGYHASRLYDARDFIC